MDMVHDNAEFYTTNFDALKAFINEHEATAVWLSDEDGCRADGVRFLPVYPEPLCVPAEVQDLKENKLIEFLDGHQRMAQYASTQEAYEDTMYIPNEGYNGSAQLMYLNGKLYPIGLSAVNGLAKRADLFVDGWEKMRRKNPKGLSEVLDRLMKETDGYLTVLVQDGKVRAVNSGKYAACPYAIVMQAVDAWIKNEYPDVEFENGFVCHDFTEWNFNLDQYTNDILNGVPALISLGFTPALKVKMSHTGTSSVSYQPCLRLNGVSFPIGKDITAEHIAKGGFSERLNAMKKAVATNLHVVFPKIAELAKEVAKLETIQVNNAYNALLRGMKFLGMPKQQALEAAAEFRNVYGDGPTSAFELYMSICDTLAYVIRDYPQDYRKHMDVIDGMDRAVVGVDWAALGNQPGDFSW